MKAVLIIIVSFLIITALVAGIALTKKQYSTNANSCSISTIISCLCTIVLVIALIFVLLMGPIGMITVNEGEVVVVRTNGIVTSTELPGLKWRNIFTTKLEVIDTKIQQLNLDKEIYVQDNNHQTQTLKVYTSSQFVVNQSLAQKIVTTFGNLDTLITRLRSEILGKMETASYGLTLEYLCTGVGKVEYQSKLTQSLQDYLVENTYCIDFQEIIIKDFIMNEALEAALMKIRVANAENNVRQIGNELETERIIQVGIQTTTRADSASKVATIAAEGEAEASRIATQARTHIIQQIAKSQSQALTEKLVTVTNILYNETEADPTPETIISLIEYLAFLEKWGGSLPTNVAGDISGMLASLSATP